MSRAYYGKHIIKPPEWTDLIPLYFFTGGLAGASATVAFAQRCARNDALARTMIGGSAAATAVSMYCLIADLKRPERFANMLRVFKPTSPMSVGVYIFSAFGSAIFAAAASEFSGAARGVGRVSEALAAFLGPAMSVYTSVLIGDTVVPAWYRGRRTLPFVFAATSASSAGALGLLFGQRGSTKPSRRLAMLGAGVMPLALACLHREAGNRIAHAYDEGQAGTLSRAARRLNATGAVCAALARKHDAFGRAAGILLLAGALAERFGIYRAGVNSARDPAYVIDDQRQPQNASAHAH